MIFDTFPFHDELDVLECRLYELESIPDLVHVIVEAEVDHQDRPKPSYLSDNWARFERWHHRIQRVWATGLPTASDDPDPWAREIMQREHTAAGLAKRQVEPGDVILHGDVDEIPTAVVARNLRPKGIVALSQKLYTFAVDWLHPDPWMGTVACTAGGVKSFGALRDTRNVAPGIDGGWHLSWLGGEQRARKKLGSFCHLEVEDRIAAGLDDDNVFLREGWHTDGKKLIPVDVDSTWPRWVVEGKCPESWYRPR